MTQEQLQTGAGQNVVHVIQGEHRVSSRADDILSTLLGSCVATCLCDPVARIGGMNHFLLPAGDVGQTHQLRYGSHAMELLINALLKKGARKDRLEAKLFGGAQMHDGLGAIGSANGRFAQDFLAAEGIRCVATSLGGTAARRVRYHPVSGRAQQMQITDPTALKELPARTAPKPDPKTDVVFF
ncbi:chemotaxis protein CheD [Tranquillimonas rosea]|uniref:chemotaxis protein CheD n=1 Tax=Tranquillimonas rosea TaxID=641238 RepID=UPI003BAD11B7